MIPPLWTQGPVTPAQPPSAVPVDGVAGVPTFAMLLIPPVVADPSSLTKVGRGAAPAQDGVANGRIVVASVPPLEHQAVMPRDLAPVAADGAGSPTYDIPQGSPTLALPSAADAVASVVERHTPHATAPMSPDPGPIPGERARVFNQDGFFGTATIAAPVTPPSVQAQPAGVPPATVSMAAEPPSDGDMPTREAPISARALPPPAAKMKPFVPVPARQHHITPQASAAPSIVDRRSPRSEPARAAPLPQLRRPMPLPPAAFVAVAVRAVAHGIDVVARIDGRDPAAGRLSDEIAALLSRHGHAPGRVAVLAPLDTRKER